MNDISCGTVRSLADFHESRGFDVNAFFARVEAADPSDPFLKREFLSNPRNFISWKQFAIVNNSLGEEFQDPRVQMDFFHALIKSPTSKWLPVKTIVSLVASPATLYKMFAEVIGPSAFGKTLKSSFETRADGKFVMRLSIPETETASAFYFVMSASGIASIPILIGLPDARVATTSTAYWGEYVITPPASATLWARFKRMLKTVLRPNVVFEELQEQQEQFKQDFAKLLVSEAELKRTREELESRVKAMNTLAGGLSHEINNVLQGVFLSLDAAETAAPAGPLKDRVQMAKKFAARGMDVMREVLIFSRETQIPRRPIQPMTMIRESLEVIRSTLPMTIALREERTGEFTKAIAGDETRLQQILTNLCTNAAYAMRERGGTVVVRYGPVAGEKFLIEVSDEGEGIPADIRARIFDPFFSTKPVGTGSGMGLPVVAGIVRAFGGDIAIDSESEKGTRFRITVPVIEAKPQERSQAPNPETGRDHGHLLILDDESDLLDLLRDILEETGYRITTKDRGADALDVVRSGSVDLVLADLMMPGESGVEIARKIKALRPKTPILLCTGLDDESVAEEDRDLFSGILMKPLDRARLLKAIRRSLSDA